MFGNFFSVFELFNKQPVPPLLHLDWTSKLINFLCNIVIFVVRISLHQGWSAGV